MTDPVKLTYKINPYSVYHLFQKILNWRKEFFLVCLITGATRGVLTQPQTRKRTFPKIPFA